MPDILAGTLASRLRSQPSPPRTPPIDPLNGRVVVNRTEEAIQAISRVTPRNSVPRFAICLAPDRRQSVHRRRYRRIARLATVDC